MLDAESLGGGGHCFCSLAGLGVVAGLGGAVGLGVIDGLTTVGLLVGSWGGAVLGLGAGLGLTDTGTNAGFEGTGAEVGLEDGAKLTAGSLDGL